MEFSFTYTPLPANSIRLVELMPASRRRDPLRCITKSTSLDPARISSYEALSYVWGEPTRKWPLTCNGMALPITKNCHEALVNLRRRFVPRVLWIDAICINQGDTDEAIDERNSQVKIMGEIYFKAKQVLVWLGEGDSTTSTLFRYLRTLHLLEGIEDEHPALESLVYPVLSTHLDLNHGKLEFCFALRNGNLES